MAQRPQRYSHGNRPFGLEDRGLWSAAPAAPNPTARTTPTTRAHVCGVQLSGRSPRQRTDPDAKTAPASSALTTASVQHTADAMTFHTLTFAANVHSLPTSISHMPEPARP
jgi:hypothetical protein